MQPEQERGHDTEVPATAAKRPEQVRVRVGAGRDELAGREHDVGLDEVVDGQPELSRQMAEAAPEGESADAGIGDDPGRHGQSEGVGRMIHVPEQGATLDTGGPRDRIDPNATHAREIDDEAVIDGAETGSAVSAAPDGDVEPLVATEADCRDDVGDIGGTDDQRRASIDHAVLDAARVVVARVLRADDVASEGPLQPFERALVDALLGCGLGGHGALFPPLGRDGTAVRR